MASVPFVRRQRDATALGGQQAQRLQQLRLASERHVQDQHLQLSLGAIGAAEPREEPAQSPVFPHSTRASRTVEAVIESRLTATSAPTKAVRLRETIRDARGGIQTERSANERPRTTAPVVAPAVGANAIRPATHTSVATKAPGIRQKIAAVRRRHPTAAPAAARKLTRGELEWIEKQLQFSQRIGLVEKECVAWWHNFYASAGETTSGIGNTGDTWTTTLSIQKQIENCDQRRGQDARDMQQQLNMLRSQADDVIHMVHAMRDGTQFITDLQEAMDAFEAALSAFRVAQREKFDAHVLEEKLLDRDLGAFVQKMEAWEQEGAAKKTHKTAMKPAKSSRMPATNEPIVRSRRGAEEVLEVSFDEDSCSPPQLDVDNAEKPEQENSKSEVDLVKRVRQLNNHILQSGGLKGGWDDREHAVFAATLLKCGLTDDIIMANQLVHPGSNQEDGPNAVDFEAVVAKFLRKCIKAVVTKSDNAVRNHFDWYVSHLQLLQEKKEVIQQWKLKKEKERQQLISQGLHQVSVDHDQNDDLRPDEGCGTDGVGVTDERRKELEMKERARKNRQLEAWREEKERRAAEKLERERELVVQRDAREAQKRQELIEKKQQVLLYKLQKDEESTALQRNRGDKSVVSHSAQGTSEEVLLKRSRKAIEAAKSKRAQIQAIEERRQKQQELPERPKSVSKRNIASSGPGAASPTDLEGSPSTKETTLLKPTKAYEARQLSKLELKRKERERSKQGAHDTYFPGAGVVSDVKIKNFGHIPIAPRAVPTWRQNI